MKAILFIGHESRYGMMNLVNLFDAKSIKIKEVVLADHLRWQHFRSQLAGTNHEVNRKTQKAFDNKLSEMISFFEEKNVEYRVVNDANDPELIGHIQSYDLLISAAFPQIFKKEVVAAPKEGAINFHPSYLPRCRGANPIYWTIASGEEFGGVSCHYMTEKLDEGPIVARRKIQIDPKRTLYSELYDLVEKETPLLISDMDTFLSEKLDPISQEKNSSYFTSDRTLHRKIYFQTETSNEISSKVRAGGAFGIDKYGSIIYLRAPINIEEDSNWTKNHFENRVEAGTVLYSDNNFVVVKTIDGVIKASFRFTGVTKVLKLISKNKSVPLFSKIN